MGWMKSFALIGSLTFSVMSIFEGKGHPPGVEPPTAYWLYHLSCRRQSLQRDIASATAVVSDTISKVSTKLDLSDTVLFQLFQKLKFKTQTKQQTNETTAIKIVRLMCQKRTLASRWFVSQNLLGMQQGTIWKRAEVTWPTIYLSASISGLL